ncbi:hypothetical protein L3X38_012149 [Prunus dulcis]|uniref:Uncharacterized protein n=1 Tax=Prunus dulcis TaxID=3755 RepID=A0AAD4ZEY6_PRUDU|nr:hypothetical protein L3X38_012149 [Prunus dulcis]
MNTNVAVARKGRSRNTSSTNEQRELLRSFAVQHASVEPSHDNEVQETQETCSETQPSNTEGLSAGKKKKGQREGQGRKRKGLDQGKKEIRVVLSVKMVSQHQSKDSGSKKNEGEELKMVAPQDKSSKKMKFASSSAETEPTSQTTISDDSKTGRGMSTMPRVVKRKLQKLRPIV